MRGFNNSIRHEVAKHFAEFFLEVESKFERVNLDSCTSVLRQLAAVIRAHSRTERVNRVDHVQESVARLMSGGIEFDVKLAQHTAVDVLPSGDTEAEPCPRRHV